MVVVPIKIALSTDQIVNVSLRAHGIPGVVSLTGDTLEFSIAAGRHVYLSSGSSTRFALPPDETALPLSPDRSYVLRGDFTVSGGQAGLWLIEYDDRERLCHQKQSMGRTRSFRLRWKTHERHRLCRLALRLSGSGRLRCGLLELAPDRGREPLPEESATRHGRLRAGPRGEFGAHSIFFDPCGHRAWGAEHHHFYDEREPDWYHRMVEKVRGCRRVLDIGCGPGLLLQALASAGVEHVIGLERNPHFVGICRERNLPVIEHDLNDPFPFLRSANFDAVIAHQSLDYLAPIAIRCALRESHRVLRPGGKLHIVSRSDGQASGDVTRTVPLGAALLRRLIEEAGFEDLQVSSPGRAVRATATRPAGARQWATRDVALCDGSRLSPWGTPVEVLPNDPNAWDQLGNRDFTLLTDAEKSEVRIEDHLVAFYTGYRWKGDRVERAICRAESRDGLRWDRSPAQPVLTAGAKRDWNGDGVAAGSAIRVECDGAVAYRMYYSGRNADGRWSGIGLATSRDGVNWHKQPQRLLSVDDYPNLRYLLLADVIRTSFGIWLMHCEGWIEGRGWAVFQAESDDGLEWRPTQPGPVLDPSEVPWGGAHAANPKCLELVPGKFLLGFNAAHGSFRFQLALAESEDACRWRVLAPSPLICTTGGAYRVESFFATQQAWRSRDRQVYFFAAAKQSTQDSSRVLSAKALPDACWVGAPWETVRPGLFHIAEDRLVARPGSDEPELGLQQVVPILRDFQCALRLRGGSKAEFGSVSLVLEGDEGCCTIKLRADGACLVDDREIQPAGADPDAVAMCLRVHRSRTRAPEWTLQVWHADSLVLNRHEPLSAPPHTLRAAIGVPSDAARLEVDHFDVWQPPVIQVESFGDAHMYVGVCGTDDELLPDIDGASFDQTLARHEIGRALVMPYGSTRTLDSFDQICASALKRPGTIYPLARFPNSGELHGEDAEYRVNQLELLWQIGRLFGLKVHLRRDGAPGRETLDWIERRQVLTFWHVACDSELEWLIDDVLSRYRFPVLLSHFAGHPLNRKRYTRAIELLDRFEQLWLVSSVVWYSAYLEKAVRRHPDRVLLGSDFPAVDPSAARGTIQHLDIDQESRTLVVSENLRFLTERVQWFRQRSLQERADLRFPCTPQDSADVERQGFVVVPPGDFQPSEFNQAKEFWSSCEIKSSDKSSKPWARQLAELVADLKPRSVLEFGCNVGRNLAVIAEANPDVRLVGIDVNPEAVRMGREATGLDLRHGDEHLLDQFADGEFDLVFTVSVLDHIPEIREICRSLVRCAGRNVFMLEVTLPVEGKVVRHYDHRLAEVRESTGASYSWHIAKYLDSLPRVRRLDCRPTYLHSGSLGPFYWSYLAFLDSPGSRRAADRPAR